MTTAVTPTPVPTRHLGRKLALGAAAVAFGAAGALVIEAWTDSDPVTDTPTVVEPTQTRMGPISADAIDRWAEADHERFCQGLHTPDAIEACLRAGQR